MKKLRVRKKAWAKAWSAKWHIVLPWALLLGTTLVLFTWQLITLNHGFSQQEIDYVASSDTIHELLQTSAFMPHRLSVYVLAKLGVTHLAAYRIIGVFIGFAAVLAMFYILRKWYTRRVALLGTLLFASSSIVLHATRIALPEVMFLLIAPIIALGLWLQKTRHHKRALVALFACLSLTAYIPGFIWISVAVLGWQGRRIFRAFWRSPLWLRGLTVLIVLGLLAPFVVVSVLHPSTMLQTIGLPTTFPGIKSQLSVMWGNLSGLVWRYHTTNALVWVSGTPWFDIFCTIMLVLGIYSLRFERKLVRSRLQLGVLATFGGLVLIGGPVNFTVLAPIAYLIIAGGVAFMLQQWFTVFPRNPIARWLAVALVGMVVCSSAYYNTYRYFVAWPGNPNTSTAFSDTNLLK